MANELMELDQAQHEIIFDSNRQQLEFLGVRNLTSGKIVAVTSEDYEIVQHRELIENFDTALNNFNLQYTRTLSNLGNRIIVDYEFADQKITFANLNEEFTVGFRVINSYDKTTGVLILPKFKRLACMNGMVITGFQKNFGVAHHQMTEDLQDFVESRLHAMINASDKLQKMVSVAMESSLEWTTCVKLIEKLMWSKKHRNEVCRRLGIEIIEEDGKIVNFIHKQDNYTKWEIYNAITNYCTYGTSLRPRVEEALQRRASKLLVKPVMAYT